MFREKFPRAYTLKLYFKRRVKTSLVSVQSPHRRARHPLAAVLGRVVIVDDQRVTDDACLATQGQVRVSEELLGGAQIDDSSRHVQISHFGCQVPDPAAQRRLVGFTVLVNPEKRTVISLETPQKITLNARSHSCQQQNTCSTELCNKISVNKNR